MASIAPGTWDAQRLKQDRLRRLQEGMKRRDIGALYLTEGTNIRYVLNQQVPGAELFVPADGQALGLIRSRDMGYVSMGHENVRSRLYDRAALRSGTDPGQAGRFIQGIKALMAEHGVAGGQLAVDALPVDTLLAVAGAGVRVVDAGPLLEHVVTVKTQDEVAIYRLVNEMDAHATRTLRDALRPGVSERELAALVESAWREAGGEDIAQLNICSGENMNPWRRWPTERRVEDGEFVGIDLHGRGPAGLRGDTSRTFFVGDRPTEEQLDLYRCAYDYIRAAPAAFQAGRSFSEALEQLPPVPAEYRTLFKNYDPAHGVGMGNSGFPHISHRGRGADEVLKPNQVLAVECYFGEVGSPLAVKLEEVICVREGPPELLSCNVPFDEKLASS